MIIPFVLGNDLLERLDPAEKQFNGALLLVVSR